MNQDTQVDTVPFEQPGATPQATAPRPSVAGWVAIVLVLLVAVAAGAGVYYLWMQNRGQSQAMALVQRELEQLQGQLRDRDTTLSNDLATLRAQQKAHQDALDILKARQDDTHTQSSREWTLREVEYLLQIASQRLQLERDVDSAVVALAAADERLRELADPSLLSVRRQLAIELTALRSVPQLDRDGLVLKLISFAQRVDQLPLANAPPPVSSVSAPATATAPATRDWRVALDAAWEALQRLVVIRRDNEPIQPMLAPEQEYFLRQNLRLQFESARAALLRDDAASFKASLQSTERWLQQYFDSKDQSVSSAIEALHAMAEQNIRPALPDINESLRLLRLQLAPAHVMEGRAPTAPLPGIESSKGRRVS